MTGFAGKQARVLIIVENLPVPFDRRVWQEAQALRKADYEVSIICPRSRGYERKYEELDGIHIYRHPLPWEGSGWVGYALEYGTALVMQFTLAWKVLFQRGFDVIQACNPPDNIFLVAAVFKLGGKKFVFDHHDITPELFEAKFGRKGVLHRLMLFWERMSFRLADISIATNESYRRIAIGRGGMPPDKVFVVRSGPNLERMRITPPKPGLRHGRRFLIGYVGVMGEQEGVDHLLRVAAELVLVRKRTDIQFTLVGGGTSLEMLRRYAHELGVQEYVRFTGRVPDDELLDVLNTADVCVNPDVPNAMNDMSTMNKIMEYMALAKPIVQYDLTEGRVSAQGASLYARPNDIRDFADKILVLLDDPDLRSRMGAEGRRRIEDELAWEHEEPKLLEAYRHLFAKR